MQSKTVFLLQDTFDSIEQIKKGFTEDQRFTIVGEEIDGEKAVDKIIELRPDVVVSEIVLSGYDGLSVIENVLKKTSDVKFVILSVLKGEEIIEKALSETEQFVQSNR